MLTNNRMIPKISAFVCGIDGHCCILILHVYTHLPRSHTLCKWKVQIIVTLYVILSIFRLSEICLTHSAAMWNTGSSRLSWYLFQSWCIIMSFMSKIIYIATLNPSPATTPAAEKHWAKSEQSDWVNRPAGANLCQIMWWECWGFLCEVCWDLDLG